ncbi:ABC-2 type transport system permease protein [Micrococcus sp. 140720015-1]|nr:hypothetical protein [Micrococcus luteus]
MINAIHADLRRLATLRSTWIYAILLTGACYGPIILMTLLYNVEYAGPIDAGDLGKCASIFQMVAIVFAGATVATEIRNGSVGISFLTQRRRWTSLASGAVVGTIFLTVTYVVGMALAILVAQFYPDSITIGSRGWPYLAAQLLVILIWALAAAALAVTTRSIAASVAIPIVWMLLIENLIAMVPMLKDLINWMPFNAGHAMLGHVLGESTASPWPGVIVLTVLTLLATTAAATTHTQRDIPA